MFIKLVGNWLGLWSWPNHREGHCLMVSWKNKALAPAVTRSPLALQSLACLNHSQHPEERMSPEALVQGSKWI